MHSISARRTQRRRTKATEIIKCTGTRATTAAPGREIKYLAIHYTAGTQSKGGAALNTAKFFAGTGNAGGSADFIVDDESAVQYNPDVRNRYCWAVGGHYATKGGALYGKATNRNCISIEICSTSADRAVHYPNDKNWKFTNKALDNAVKLARQLMQDYQIPAGNVIRHYDVSGKCCPGIVGWNADSGDESKWLKFKARLVESAVPEVKEEAEVRYNTIAELPEWARPSVQKLIDAGKLNGSGGKKDKDGNPADLNLSEDMVRLIVMLS